MNTANILGPPARQELLAADLSQAPQVNALLSSLGLGHLDPLDLVSYPGRNKNWAGTTSRDRRVFVKQLEGSEGPARLERAVRYERTQAAHDGMRVLSPPCLGWDESAGLMVFELLTEAESGSDRAGRPDGFGPDWCRRAGQLIAATHQLPPPCAGTEPAAAFIPLGHVQALPLDTFANASRAELEAWALLQRDDEVIEALEQLNASSLRADRRPVHADLRLDQFLVSRGELYLSDWEEFRLADPARDIGSFTGEWLHRAVLAAAPDDAGTGLTHPQAVARITAEIKRIRPRISAFWNGYLEAHDHRADADRAGRADTGPPPHGDGLEIRATAFAGWHLYDRLLAGASHSPRLGAMSRAAAGIGRRIVLSAERFTAAVGLGEAR
ncbi:class V lanthionine synthetase subunit LxmK [Streptomyces sp. NPDC091265]|uniref:class V lanthionine synthetase subunit LxmK n=1 Tax=unclassified Streptomyces TaxID=2593676 RepID=UPI00344F5049